MLVKLKTRTNLRKPLRNVLNCYKLERLFKNKTRSIHCIQFKDQISKHFTFGVDFKFQCELCNKLYYGECVWHLNVRISKHIGTSSVTKKQLQPKNNFLDSHLLLCNNSASYADFSILKHRNKTFYYNRKRFC